MRIVIFFALVCGICFYGSAQSNKRKQNKTSADTLRSTHMSGVPDKLMEKFSRDYPTAIEMKWSKESEDEYKVIFKDPPNTQQLIVYDKDWKVIRRETELEKQHIPDSILNFYKQNYPSESHYKVWLKEDINGKIYYSNGMEFGLYFDMNGKIIKREPYK